MEEMASRQINRARAELLGLRLFEAGKTYLARTFIGFPKPYTVIEGSLWTFFDRLPPAAPDAARHVIHAIPPHGP